MSKRKRAQSEADVSWRVHRMADDGLKGTLVFVAATVCSTVAIGLVGLSPLSLCLVALFIYSLSDYLLPHDYQMDTAGVHVTTALSRSTMPWRRVRGVALSTQGVLLTPLPRRTTLDRWRGLFVWADEAHRDLIVARARRHGATA